MIPIILEAALRSFGLGAITWLVLKTLRIRHPKLERNAWLVVLVCALAMPWLMQVELFSAISAADLPWQPYVQRIAMTAPESGTSLIEIAAQLYVAIAVTLVTRQAFGVFKAWRLRRQSGPLDADARIRMSAQVRSPVSVFSTIIVSSDFATWSDAQQRAAIAHEAAHVANGDFYIQQLAQLHRSLFWINPLSWWLVKRLSLLSEHISDDAALQAMPQGATYAEFLLSFARGTTHGEHAVAMARPSTLVERIERILSDRANQPTPRAAKRVATIAALLPFVALAAGISSSIANEVATPRAGKGVVLPRSNPAFVLSQPVYPPPSQRLFEAGTVVLLLRVETNGRVSDAIVKESSGFIELDNAARYESFRWKLDPGTVNGVPEPMWGKFAVTFKLGD